MSRIAHLNLARGYRGGERQTELLIRELARRGVAQRLVARRGQPLAARLADLSDLEIVPVRKPFAMHLAAVRGAVLHAHETRAAQLAWLRSRVAGTPYIVTRRIGKRPSASVVTRAIYRDAAACVGVAGSVAREIADYANRDVATIYSALSDLPVDPTRARALRKRWGDAFVVLNVAALVDAQKGQSHLIEAARRAAAQRPSMHFVLAGAGRDRQVFERQANGLANVEFAGFVDNVGDYLAAADAFVLPSRHEGIGGAALDAMRAGLPVVASAVDGLPEFVDDGYNGLLVPPGDPNALYDAIARLQDEPELARSLGTAGRRTAVRFSVARMADAYQALYARIAHV
ncbi:glycosyltransferase family 4 protein [Salinisphaera sp. SPP-AMP-43]|uniref:glycosyltransferase family 4 protein n=1 Tax=Salinisphaera sp. SPP-AMP-43 TaxID=3121288 RepID=UPI003C6DBCC6